MDSEAGAPERAGSRRVAGLVGLAASGVILAVLPHLLAWARTGDPSYVADSDGLLYLAWSRDVVRHGRGVLVDAVHPQSGPMMHPWLIFVPPAWLAYATGIGMTGLGVLWRVLAGSGIAFGLFAALRPAVRDPRIALGAAALLLFDPGFLFGQPVEVEAQVIASVARGCGSLFEGVPRVMPHLRVVTPGLALPFLLVHYGLTLRARLAGDSRSALLAAASFGLLFYVFFFFWTMVLAGTVLALVLDRRGRRTFAIILGVGVILGAPAVLQGMAVRAATPPDWLWRTDKFTPIGHFQHLLVPRVLVAEWLAAGVLVFRSRRELVYPWCCVGAGLFCLNHQLVTGLQIENFHWVQAVGTTFAVLVAALAIPWVFERRQGGGRLKLLAALVAAQVVVGLVLRVDEATRTRDTQHWARIRGELRRDGIAPPSGAVVAGDRDAIFVAAAFGESYPLSGRLVEFSARATDAELDERLMLNLFLSGVDRAEATRLANLPAGALSWEALAVRSPERARLQRKRRLRLVADIWSDPRPWIERLGVTHVLIPPSSASHLDRLADRIKPGRHWDLWRVRRGLDGTDESPHTP